MQNFTTTSLTSLITCCEKINFAKLIAFFSLIILLTTSTTFSQSNEDCMTCHSDTELTMEKNNKQISLFVNENKLKNSVHSKLRCVSCHIGFSAEELPHKENIEPLNCMTCHKDAGAKHQFHPQLLRARGTETSPNLSCKGCHGTHDVLSMENANNKFSKNRLTESCGACHNSAKDDFTHSSHSKALANNVPGAPSCLTCHETQITLKPTSDTLKVKIAQEKMCLSCHVDNKEVRERLPYSTAFIKSYESSVHGQALILRGNAKAANCIDCHNSHKIIPHKYPESSIFKTNVATTCSKCHAAETKEFNESIHGQALIKGNMDSPSCTDCHGEHNILTPQDPDSPVNFENLAEQTCAPCHSSVQLSEQYGFSAGRVQSFVDSYHGLALRGGSATVANCASCHGVHNIKPSSDPTSLVHKSNLAETCGSCHPGANENFAIGTIHLVGTREEAPIVYWISVVYIILLITILGGMLIHNTLDMYRKAVTKLKIRRGSLPAPHHVGHRLYLRMTLSERLQHLSLMLSFFILVITGFMLSYPDAWWVTHIRDFIPGAFEIRSVIHRVAGVVMMLASLYHLYYILFTPRGKQLLKDLMPKLQDLTDAKNVLMYNIGVSKIKPRFDRFSYIEKSEYWALVWGTVLMSITGIVMWFENTFINLFTVVGWDIARTIHYYEAWLAFLAIVIWHVYFVIFNPSVYPMNLTWLTGTITEEEMEDEHPLELERIKAEEAKKSEQK